MRSVLLILLAQLALYAADIQSEQDSKAEAVTNAKTNAITNVKEEIPRCTLRGELRDVIGPASFDYLERLQEKAKEKDCASIYLRINTPGGSLQSTRKIVELIMNSPVPVLCLIYPSGGHAGSAGAIIMQACHVNGAMEATNIGAASPVAGGGQEIPEDMRKKLFEDTRSWVEGIAKYRGRNVEFARDIVTEAKALDAREAAKEGAIDIVAMTENDFLEFAETKTVKLSEDKETKVAVGGMDAFDPDLRHDFLQILSNPQWAYLLFMASLGLLYYELTNPGVILPGVVGAIGLVVSLVNFHMLDVSWGAVALIVLGLAFIFAELFVPSFGALGLGGIVSITMGSLFLFDEKQLGQTLPLSLIVSTVICFSLLAAGVTYLAYQAIVRGRENRARESWVGKQGRIKSFHPTKQKGMVFIEGELWKCKSKEDLKKDDEVVIDSVKGLTLMVSKAQ